MKWLITGGAGFIGTNLIAHLIQAKPDALIRVVDNLSASVREDLQAVCDFNVVSRFSEPSSSGVELVIGDIRDPHLALHASKGMDAIIHLAACTGVLPSVDNPRQDCETNVIGVLNYLIAAKEFQARFCLASSGATVGEQEPPIHEEKVPRPKSPYGASKLCGEAYCHAFHGSYEIAAVALRFGNVYGPRSVHKQSIVAKFIKRALAGDPLVIYGEGNQTRDFIYVEDLIDAIVKATLSGTGGEVFQIATHRETTVSDLTSKLVKILKERAGVVAQVQHSSPMAGEVIRNYSDISKAKRVLGWEPQTTLEEGLNRTVEWFLNHSSLSHSMVT